MITPLGLQLRLPFSFFSFHYYEKFYILWRKLETLFTQQFYILLILRMTLYK